MIISVFTTVKREKFSCKTEPNKVFQGYPLKVFTCTAESFIHITILFILILLTFWKFAKNISCLKTERRWGSRNLSTKFCVSSKRFLNWKKLNVLRYAKVVKLTDYFIHSRPWFQWNPTKQNRKHLRRLSRQQWDLSHDDQAFLSQFYCMVITLILWEVFLQKVTCLFTGYATLGDPLWGELFWRRKSRRRPGKSTKPFKFSFCEI